MSEIDALQCEYLDLLADARKVDLLTGAQIRYLMVGENGRVKQGVRIGQTRPLRPDVSSRSSVKSFVSAAVAHGALNIDNALRLGRLINEVEDNPFGIGNEIGEAVCAAIGENGRRAATKTLALGSNEREKRTRRLDTLGALKARGFGAQTDGPKKPVSAGRAAQGFTDDDIARLDAEDDRRQHVRLAALTADTKPSSSCASSKMPDVIEQASKHANVSEPDPDNRPPQVKEQSKIDAAVLAREYIDALSHGVGETMSPQDMSDCLRALTEAFPRGHNDPGAPAWCSVAGSLGLMQSVVSVGLQGQKLDEHNAAKQWIDDATVIYLSLLARACKLDLISSRRLRELLLGDSGRTRRSPDNPASGHTVKSFVRYVTTHGTLGSSSLNTLAGLLALLADRELLDTRMTSSQVNSYGRVRSLGANVSTGYGSKGKEGLIAFLEREPAGSKGAEFYQRLEEYGFIHGVDASKSADNSNDTGFVSFGDLSLLDARDLLLKSQQLQLKQIAVPRQIARLERMDKIIRISKQPTSVGRTARNGQVNRPSEVSPPAGTTVRRPLERPPSVTPNDKPSSWASRLVKSVRSKIARFVLRIRAFFGDAGRTTSHAPRAQTTAV